MHLEPDSRRSKSKTLLSNRTVGNFLLNPDGTEHFHKVTARQTSETSSNEQWNPRLLF